jgi:hypothetical protein
MAHDWLVVADWLGEGEPQKEFIQKTTTADSWKQAACLMERRFCGGRVTRSPLRRRRRFAQGKNAADRARWRNCQNPRLNGRSFFFLPACFP